MTCVECGEVLDVLESFNTGEYITHIYKCPVCGTEYEIGSYNTKLTAEDIEFSFQELVWGCDYMKSDMFDIEDEEDDSVVGTYSWNNGEVDVSIISPSEKEKLKHEYWKK